jgi:3-hydroxymyristoyl/3-hydroxydecanoyl-(acyl carrier protein) dehydratase
MKLLPTVLNHVAEPEAVFTLAMDADLLAFQGHFPGNPILPGVVQVDWAIHFGTAAFGPLGAFRGIDNLKFHAIIRPGEVVELHLGFERGERLRFSFCAGAAKKSSGVILFQAG